MHHLLNTLVMATLFAVSSATTLLAEELVLPPKPDPHRFSVKVPRFKGFIGMFNTSVVRYNDGHMEVFYGFIFGNPKRDGLIFVVNDITGTECEGETSRQPDKSGKGEMRCTTQGALTSVSPVEIATGTYGKLKGGDTGMVLDPEGIQIGSILTRWNGWDFPDATEMSESFP